MKIHYSILIVAIFFICTSERPPHEALIADLVKDKSELELLRERDESNAMKMREKEEDIIQAQNELIKIIYKDEKRKHLVRR